ncbi:MAG: tyrosine--tRNA ligase, partial [Candidatus Uhrbacteria bacterium]|nr:tyrosine--tRNA ligase [Candidatus Uhrbacteria bacterium]
MSKSKIIIDPTKIDWFLTHAVEHVYPSREALREKLMSGERISVYLGFDPTGPVLHLGHTITLQKLRELQELGHRIIWLIGDFTAMIGDPTDKSAARQQLTREEVLQNCKNYKQQASKILKFDGPNPVEIKFNNDWLGKMSFKDVVDLASHFTVQQMMKRDMFEKRMVDDKPIFIHEFLYPLMQGYDSVAMDVDLEVCGNDQTFNALAGRTLMKEIKHKEKFVLTTKLLTDSSGKKMSKTEGALITLADSPEDMYGKVMSWSDGMIVPGFEICTDATSKEVDAVRQGLKKGENPMTLKRELARRIVAWLIGESAADRAAEHFSKMHQKHEKPEEIPVVRVGAIHELP